jgi:ubiquinone/menaquinone biosynthesis C-methylase UbiE
MKGKEKMEAYTGFAEVYDMFMDNVPYVDWAGYLCEVLREYGISDGLVLELGCGTGNLAMRLADAGYDMIGVDASPEMLEIAMDKKVGGGYDILYLLQDMREFELYGTVRAAVSVCDSINYITEPEELVQVFGLVNNYLDPSGIFVFDFNTDYKYRELLGNQTIAEDREESSFIWDNYYEEETGMNEYELTLFIREEDGRYGKYQETHVQKGYTLEEMKEFIQKSGMEFVAAYDAYTKEPPSGRSERISVVAREKGKSAG